MDWKHRHTAAVLFLVGFNAFSRVMSVTEPADPWGLAGFVFGSLIAAVVLVYVIGAVVQAAVRWGRRRGSSAE